MKVNEEEIRETMGAGRPFTIVTDSGERAKVRGRDWIFLPPLEDEDGHPLTDDNRSDFFQVWGNGKSYRWIAFRAANFIDTKAPDQEPPTLKGDL